MIGPVVLLVGGVVLGTTYGGLAGAVIGLSMGAMSVGGIVVLASAWAQRVAPMLEPDVAWAEAPRPPGFAGLCDWVYRRQLPTDL